MSEEEVKKLSNGAYKVFWSSGGSSIAAVGRDYYGNVWLHPSNWINTNAPIDYWEDVKKVELIKASKH